MRIAALSLVGAVCLAASAIAANAAPSAPSPAAGQANAHIVRVAGGCGWGFHTNRWHRCVPNRYGYYRARPYWRGYYGGGYYGGGYYGAGYYGGGFYGGGAYGSGSPSGHPAND